MEEWIEDRGADREAVQEVDPRQEEEVDQGHEQEIDADQEEVIRDEEAVLETGNDAVVRVIVVDILQIVESVDVVGPGIVEGTEVEARVEDASVRKIGDETDLETDPEMKEMRNEEHQRTWYDKMMLSLVLFQKRNLQWKLTSPERVALKTVIPIM